MAQSKRLESPSQKERSELIDQLQDKLELPMVILGFAWLILTVLELTLGLSGFLVDLNKFIWGLFVFEFAFKFFVAPFKVKFLKKNWLGGLSLILPALRIFRIFRAVRIFRSASALRGLRFARLLTSMNRGIRALGRSLGRRGFGYVISLTALVTFAGGAGIYSFEKEFGVLTDYGTSVWWTAMLLTTMGSDYFPKSNEGRLLCLLLATYGFAIFGYVTATVATFFVGRDAENGEAEIAGQKTLEEIRAELKKLRDDLQQMKQTQP